MSYNFGQIDLASIAFPVHLRIDYIRVYQPRGQKNIGCNPEDFPTEDYINECVARVYSVLRAADRAMLGIWRRTRTRT